MSRDHTKNEESPGIDTGTDSGTDTAGAAGTGTGTGAGTNSGSSYTHTLRGVPWHGRWHGLWHGHCWGSRYRHRHWHRYELRFFVYSHPRLSVPHDLIQRPAADAPRMRQVLRKSPKATSLSIPSKFCEYRACRSCLYRRLLPNQESPTKRAPSKEGAQQRGRASREGWVVDARSRCQSRCKRVGKHANKKQRLAVSRLEPRSSILVTCPLGHEAACIGDRRDPLLRIFQVVRSRGGT